MTLCQLHCGRCQGKLIWHPDFGAIETCVYCSRPWKAESSLPRQDNQVACYTPGTFAKALDVLEVAHRPNIESAITTAMKAVEIASMLGVEELAMRAQLIHAEVMIRKGLLADGGRILQKINAWAESHRHAYISARTHRHLSVFFQGLGDLPRALEHALHSLQLLPKDARPETRGNHLLVMGCILARSREYDRANRILQETLDIAVETNQLKIALTALNNMAYAQYELGNVEEATEIIERLRQFVQKHGLLLNPRIMDTIARVEILRGRYDESERMLQAVIDRRMDNIVNEIEMLPECFITSAIAQRLQGAYDRSQETLNEALRLCEEHGFAGYRVNIFEEQAELYAATGRYREAYEEFRKFHAESAKLFSKEREARAKILQAVFETEEAKRTSEYYRNMAFRDHLTGLYNRRYMDMQLDEWIRLSSDSGNPLSIIMMDLDHFKRINDTLSHEIGDTVLIHVAKILEAAAEEPTAAARIGGEEFLIMLPGYESKQALAFAKELCHKIHSMDWHPITGKLEVTASMGVSTFFDGISRSRLLTLADNNLYQAKREGRNRVVG